MRVLLAAFHVPSGRSSIGGVQSWIKTVRVQLEKAGHLCREWEPGMPDPDEDFDVGVFANMPRTKQMTERCKSIVCVSHGVIPDEQPLVADTTLFVSENVRDYWNGRGGILRQPIDLDFWKPSHDERKGVVCYSYRGLAPHCREVAEAIRQPFYHLSGVSHEDARSALQSADLVFASGRAALEAMACGARVVIYDHRKSYQRPLIDMNLRRQMENSYSGRGGAEPSYGEVFHSALVATPSVDWVRRHHCAKKITRQLMETMT